MASTDSPSFKIGAVSRITGIAAETLRMWERRYDVVVPTRASGNARLYSRDDISRLSMIKQLVDSGHGIGSVAKLTREQLADRLKLHRDESGLARTQTDAPRCRTLIVYGEALPFLLGAQVHPSLEVLGMYNDADEFKRAQQRTQPEVVVLELPVLAQSAEDDIQELVGDRTAGDTVIVYGYGHPRAVASISAKGFILMRAPINLGEVANAVANQPAVVAIRPLNKDLPAANGDIPPRRYDARTLGSVARMSPTVECECPQHIVELIVRLNAFEDYSASCESTSEDDAALHRYLHVTTAKARHSLEEALRQIAEAENIPIEEL